MTEFVEYYNNQRHHESLDNLTPSDVYYGRGKEILNQRELTKIKTMKKRRNNHLLQSLNL
ncbi:MAG: transposase [Flavobacteriaceae bacterium]|nr:transposase [Flavobacteriaceae bacterium]